MWWWNSSRKDGDKEGGGCGDGEMKVIVEIIGWMIF